jgi:hypothetical protein
MKEETQLQVKEIKREFRTLMNGETLRSMKEKGVNYHLNWGVNILDLRKMAEERKMNSDLAIAIWKENIRECKILATMLMPAEEMEEDLVDLWMEQTDEQEIAEQAVFNLYRHLSFAPAKAYQWMAAKREIVQLSGFLLIARIFMDGRAPDERGIHEFIDQSIAAILSSSLMVKHAAVNSIRRFMELGEPYEKIARSALKSNDLDFF